MSRAFGDFDPRFLGVSLSVSSSARMKFVYEYALGPATITDREAARLNDEDFVEQVSWITVLGHEFRHFHDHIISPLGSRTVHARCALALNTAMLLVGIYADQDVAAANVIPAPLSTWCRMSVAERKDFLAEMDRAAAHRRGQFAAPRLPLVADDGSIRANIGATQPSEWVSEAVRACWQAERALSDVYALPEGVQAPGRLDAGLVSEASAVLVQCQEILQAVGSRALNRFTAILSRPSNRYGAAFKAVLGVFKRANLPAETSAMLQFTLWCLLGDPYVDGKYASPLIRYAKLGDVLVRNGTRAMASSVHDTFDLWDQLTGSGPTLAALSDSIGRDELFRDWLMEKLDAAELGGEDGIITPVVTLLEQFMRARRHLVARLQADPEEYCTPRQYLRSLEHLSGPPVKIVVVSGGGLDLPADFEENGWDLYAGREAPATGRTAAIIVGPPVEVAGHPHIDRRTALDAYTHFTLSDILFGPGVIDVPQSDWDNASDLLIASDLRLLRIIR
jgi:hypothetical protein